MKYMHRLAVIASTVAALTGISSCQSERRENGLEERVATMEATLACRSAQLAVLRTLVEDAYKNPKAMTPENYDRAIALAERACALVQIDYGIRQAIGDPD